MSLPASSGRISEALSAAEAELSAIWQTAEGEPPKVRASTMNLLVLSDAQLSTAWLDVLDALGASHPARTLVFSVNPRLPPWALQTNVHAVCRKDPGGDVVCSERVELTLGAAALKRASSVAAALLLPELETSVVVLPTAPALLVDALVAPADRCIVDARHTALSVICDIATKTPGHLEDMGFILAFAWRDLTARFFDDPRTLPLLQHLSRVEIEHAALPDGTTPADVRMYVGWLASRLGWVLEAPDRARAPHGAIAIEVRSTARSAPLGSLAAVVLHGRLEGMDARMSVSHTEGDTGLVWSFRYGTEATERKHPLLPRDELWLLTRAVDATTTDRILREAIRAAASWRG